MTSITILLPYSAAPARRNMDIHFNQTKSMKIPVTGSDAYTAV